MVGPVFITGAEAVCGLGNDLEQCLGKWARGGVGLSTQHALVGFEHLPVGLIPERGFLKGRRYGAASNLAVHVARRAVASAGWSEAALSEAWIFAASSRGNAGELLGATAWRRRCPSASAWRRQTRSACWWARSSASAWRQPRPRAPQPA